MVNVVATCDRTMRSRVMLGHSAPTGSGQEEVLMLSEKAAIDSGGYAAESILIVVPVVNLIGLTSEAESRNPSVL